MQMPSREISTAGIAGKLHQKSKTSFQAGRGVNQGFSTGISAVISFSHGH